MNKVLKSILFVGIAAFSSASFVSCIDETEPTTVATETQVGQSSAATEALTMAMPAYLTQVDEGMLDGNGWHAVFGYPCMMMARDLMTGDFGFSTTTYASHFNFWSHNKAQGDGYLYGQYIWNYHYQFIQTANNVVGAVNPETATSEQLGFLGAGHAFRALAYLDAARMYEFLPNDKTSNINVDGNDVLNLTVPIVTNKTSSEDARNNPRATRDEMVTFILADLDAAEEYIPNLVSTYGKTLPDLACVYGLKARLYMWIEDYANAKIYARKAIDAAKVSPMTKEVGLSATDGFNTIDPWMWGGTQTSESRSVTSGIVNFTSWISNQSTYGYTGTGTGLYVIADKKFYERINKSDWRKLWFQPTEDSGLREEISYVTASDIETIPTYASIKFRPGEGNADDYQTGSAVSIPVMRVEEMYFIEAEAAAHINATDGKALVEKFMTEHRDANYVCRETETDGVVEEIVFQKRVELWGEGHTFFDIKRLNYSVTRGYEGTIFTDLARLNTEGRPAWMNLVIVRTEPNNNKAVVGFNNPDPTDVYTPWVNL